MRQQCGGIKSPDIGAVSGVARDDRRSSINILIYREIFGISGSGNGAQGRNRTTDTAIFSRMLYQLSYLGVP